MASILKTVLTILGPIFFEWAWAKLRALLESTKNKLKLKKAIEDADTKEIETLIGSSDPGGVPSNVDGVLVLSKTEYQESLRKGRMDGFESSTVGRETTEDDSG